MLMQSLSQIPMSYKEALENLEESKVREVLKNWRNSCKAVILLWTAYDIRVGISAIILYLCMYKTRQCIYIGISRPDYNMPSKMSTSYCCRNQTLPVLKIMLHFCSGPSLFLCRTRTDQISHIAVAFPQMGKLENFLFPQPWLSYFFPMILLL